MNNRIRELKLQAGIKDNPDQEGLDLFAELIVQECANVIEGQDIDPGFKHRISWAFKKKFEVEDTHHNAL